MDIATLGLRLDASGYVRAAESASAVNERLARSGGAAEASALRLRGAFGKLLAFVGAGKFFHDVVKSTEEAQYAFAALESGVRSTGGAAGFSAAQLNAMAGSLQSLTTYEDEAIEGAQALLLTFTNVRGDVFKDATGAVLDLAQRMGGDLRGASIQVGKALQDPIRGVTALRRVGVSFSESQREVIKNLVNTGHVAEAQRLILKELELEFGGSAAAARNTLGGALKGLAHDFGDLLEVSPDGTSGIVGWINTVDKGLLYLKEHVDFVQKAVAFGVGFWVTYTAVIKGNAIYAGLVALAHKAVAATATEEALAVRAATASIAGYETAAVSAGIASGALATGMGEAATAAGVLTVAGRGLLSVLTGPVGIALALTTVIALLFQYKSAQNQAAEANKAYADSLAGQTDEQLKAEETRLRERMAEQRRVVAMMRVMHQDMEIPQQGFGAAKVGAATPAAVESSAFRRQREELERLQAAYAAVGAEERRRAAFHPPPMTDMGDVEDQSARILQNRMMVETAKQGVELAREQGIAQEQLRIRFEATNKEMEANATLTGAIRTATIAAIRAERDYKLQALDVGALREQGQAREDALRTQRQSLALLGEEGAAQTRLRIEYEAVNKAVEARRNLEGSPEALNNTLTDIDRERASRLTEERIRILQGYRQQVRDIFAGLFEDIWNNGLKSFSNLFASVRQMFGRLVADMAARQFMRTIGNNLAGGLARIFGGLDKLNDTPQNRAATALTASAGSLSTAASALSAAATQLSGVGQPPVAGPNQPKGQLEGVTATGSQRFAQTLAKYIGPAIAGFIAGSAFGSATTNRGTGSIGGAASGAATGALMGGLPGAIVGGLAGAVGGFLGASRKREEAERALREVLDRNNERLRELSENIHGLTLMSGKNLTAAVAVVGSLGDLKGVGGILGGVARRRFGDFDMKDLADALKGGEVSKALQKYEQAFGVSLADVGRIARQLGIDLYDSAGKLIPAALKQLGDALALTIKAATTFTDSIDDQRRRQDAYNKLFDVPDTPLNNLNDAYALLSKGAPELLKQMGLANLDLSSEAARNVLLSGLQDLFKMIDAGLLSPELLGAFADKNALIDAILAAKDGLDRFRSVLGSVTTDFPRAVDIALYEQRYGHGTDGGTGSSTSTTPPDTSSGGANRSPRGPVYVVVNGGITMPIVNESGDTYQDLGAKVERALGSISDRGGTSVFASSTVSS